MDKQRKPEASVEIEDFRGLATNMDPHDIEPGNTLEQVNATNVVARELRVRGGMYEIRFEN